MFRLLGSNNKVLNSDSKLPRLVVILLSLVAMINKVLTKVS